MCFSRLKSCCCGCCTVRTGTSVIAKLGLFLGLLWFASGLYRSAKIKDILEEVVAVVTRYGNILLEFITGILRLY